MLPALNILHSPAKIQRFLLDEYSMGYCGMLCWSWRTRNARKLFSQDDFRFTCGITPKYQLSRWITPSSCGWCCRNHGYPFSSVANDKCMCSDRFGPKTYTRTKPPHAEFTHQLRVSHNNCHNMCLNGDEHILCGMRNPPGGNTKLHHAVFKTTGAETLTSGVTLSLTVNGIDQGTDPDYTNRKLGEGSLPYHFGRLHNLLDLRNLKNGWQSKNTLPHRLTFTLASPRNIAYVRLQFHLEWSKNIFLGKKLHLPKFVKVYVGTTLLGESNNIMSTGRERKAITWLVYQRWSFGNESPCRFT